MKNSSAQSRHTSVARLLAPVLGIVIGMNSLASCGASPTAVRQIPVTETPRVVLSDRELAAIVIDTNARNRDRRSALLKIDDQTILAEIAVQVYDEPSNLGNAALNKVRDPDILEALAAGRFGESENARVAAIDKLHDPSRLERLFHELVDVNVRLSAAVLVDISDIGLLTRLAETHPTEYGKQQARSRIEEVRLEQRVDEVAQNHANEELLKIAYSDQDTAVRAAAVEQIQDTASLTQVIVDLGGRLPGASFNSIARLKDEPESLARIALEAATSQLRLHALRWLYDDGPLLHVLTNTEDAEIGADIVRRLTNQEQLWDVASNAKPYQLRLSALALVRSPARLGAAASDDSHFEVRAAALIRVDDQALLANAALNGQHHWERYIGAARSTDRILLERLQDGTADESVIAELKLALLEAGAEPDALEIGVEKFTRVFSRPGLVRVFGEKVSIVLRSPASARTFRREFETEFPNTVRMSEINSIIRTSIDRDDLVELLADYLGSVYDEIEQAAIARNASNRMLPEAVFGNAAAN